VCLLIDYFMSKEFAIEDNSAEVICAVRSFP
jgi:hypothetical protein